MIDYDLKEFLLYNPSTEEDIVDWFKSDSSEIHIFMQDGSVYIYDVLTKTTRRPYKSMEEYLRPNEYIWRMEFSRRLERLMKFKQINQEELAELTGLTRASINNYLKCKRTPSAYVIMLISRALNCSPTELVYLRKEQRQ